MLDYLLLSLVCYTRSGCLSIAIGTQLSTSIIIKSKTSNIVDALHTESNATLRVLNYFLQYTYKQTITSYPQSLIPSVCAQAFETPTYFQPRFSNDQQAFCPRHGLNISKSIPLSSTAFYSLLMDMTSRCEERFGLLCHVSQYKVYFKISFSLK